jgi:hypothetical protein
LWKVRPTAIACGAAGLKPWMRLQNLLLQEVADDKSRVKTHHYEGTADKAKKQIKFKEEQK